MICRELINILNDGYYTFYISKLICTPPDINLAYRKLLHTSNYKPLFPDHVIISSDDILMRKHSPRCV